MIAVKNGLPFIQKTTESIRGQTYQNIEIIVVDDGFTDGTREYISGLEWPKLRLVTSRRPGFLEARLTRYQAASGSLIANMDADDCRLPTRLEAQVDFLQKNPTAVAVGTQVKFLVDGCEAPAFTYPTDPVEVLTVLRRGRPGVCDPSVMLRASAARAVPTVYLDLEGASISIFD